MAQPHVLSPAPIHLRASPVPSPQADAASIRFLDRPLLTLVCCSGCVCAMGADDITLVTALGGTLSPSPWSRFLSPSLFSQRSTPVPQVAPGPSPLKESTTLPPQPDGGCGLFTHAREINPFEKSFAVLDPEAVAGAGGRPGAGAQGGSAVAELALQLPQGRPKRKRALSSPAVFTPGGSRAGGQADEAFMKQAKRPDLRLVAKDSGVGMLDEASPATAAPYSLRSSSNSFDSTTGSSILRHRRGQSLTNSPETSIAPSPLSDKLGSNPAAFAPADSTFAHFQAQPVPFTMPPAQPPAAYPDPSLFAPTSLAPSSLGPDGAAPLPFAAQGPPFEPMQVQMTGVEAFGAYQQAHMPFIPPGMEAAYASMAPNYANPLAVSANPPHPLHLASAPLGAVPPGHYLPPTHASLAASSIPLGAPVVPSAASSAPPRPAAKGTGKKKAAAAPVNGTYSSASASPAAAASNADSTSPAPPAAPTKPPGKKRGRKPKNWDPTLERTVELDPEERERQRKLALERNRIAASKSRRRKKERVELLETGALHASVARSADGRPSTDGVASRTASSDLCSRNLALQAECRALLAEVHSLRTFLSQNHPEGVCTCQHINGYLARERDGGGIPAILYGAGATLDRDYTRTPKWGGEDDLFAGADAMESGAVLEAYSTGAGYSGSPTANGSASASGRKKAAKAGTAAKSAAADGQQDAHDTADVLLDTLAPVVGPAQGSIPLKAPTGNATSPKKQTAAPPTTRRTSSRRAVAREVEDDDHDDSEDDESEEEAIELKSRRARAIAVRNKSG